MSADWRAWIAVDVGIVLLLIGLAVLGVNEHSAAAWREGMARHGGSVLVLGTRASPAAGRSGHQVLVTGVPTVVDPPRDRDFGVRADTTLLVRKVGMFQWHEVRVGGQVTYQQDWIDHAVDSSHFDQPKGHANTQPFPFKSKRFEASKVRLDHYVLAPAIVRALPGALKPIQPDFNHLPANLQASFQERNGALTTSQNPGRPRLGDLRVSWLARPLQTITVIARADDDKLVPAAGPGQGFQIQLGTRSLTDIFPDLPMPPGAVWAWRVLAFVLVWLGAWLVLRRWLAMRMAVPEALAIDLAALGILAGVMWFGVSVVAVVVAWVIAILAVIGGGVYWRRRIIRP